MIGERLRKRRIELGMNQEELGNLIGVSKVSISGYETGIRTPNMESFMMLIDVLNVSADYLLGYDANVVEENSDYHIKMSREEIKFIKEIRLKRDIYNKLVEDPIRMVELINRRVK